MMKFAVLQLSKGFTLIESLVVLAITAILLAIGVPSMSGFIADWQLSNAVNSFTASLQLARTESLKRGRVVRMCPSSTGTACLSGAGTAWETGWIVYVDNDASGAGYAAANDVRIYAESALTGIASVTSNTGTFTEFAFNPNGLMSTGRQGYEFKWDTGGTKKKVICISRTGRARPVTAIADCSSV